MTKYRIVKNGLGHFFVEKLFQDSNGFYIKNFDEPVWVRCDYEVNCEEICQINAHLKYPRSSSYPTIERAKESLNILKNRDMSEELFNKIDVVYEE